MHQEWYSTRVANLQKLLHPSHAVVLLHPHDIFYCTGYWSLSPEEREVVLLITPTQWWFLHTSFTVPPNALSATPIELSHMNTWAASVAQLAHAHQVTHVQLSLNDCTATEYEQLKQASTTLTYENWKKEQLWQLRSIKDQQEISHLKHAASTARRALNHAHSLLAVGVSEQEIARAITLFFMEQNQENAFPPIVAFGPNTAIAHHTASDRLLSDNEPVLIDLGSRSHGYCSDMTRTFCFGAQKDPGFTKLRDTVHRAYEAGAHVLSQKKATTGAVDQAVRQVFRSALLEKNFIHSSGHGLGISVHEPPSLYQTQTTEVQPGMVLTLEPGLYLPGQFGYRHENSFLITESGAEVITE